MYRYVIVDHEDRVVRSEYADAQPRWWLTSSLPVSGARLKLAPAHPDYSAKQGERIIP